MVATIRALKFHGGVARENLTEENLEALEKGLANLDRHITNIRDNYGVPTVVSINQFIADTQAEIDLIVEHCRVRGIQVALSSHWANGGAGKLSSICFVVPGSGVCLSEGGIQSRDQKRAKKVLIVTAYWVSRFAAGGS